MKSLISTLITIFTICICACSQEDTTSSSEKALNIQIATVGNSWVMDNNKYIASTIIGDEGVSNWTNGKHIIRTFFYVGKTGKISLGLKAKVESGTSKIKVLFGNESKEIELKESQFDNIYIGDFQIDHVGYHYIDLIGLDKSGASYADVSDVLLGNINNIDIKFISDEYYWGRRGPSVHLNYEIPEEVGDIEWFYSELMIPKDQDVIGSYFMANGFNHGYFGIQVNSSTERRVLFSIWSPYQTDNPADIPEDYKIKLMKKGDGVTSGEFGNEGSGGQSYKVFDWKTEVHYRFLVGARPSEEEYTDYTAYFYDPEMNNWNLIAQFRRPKTNTYLKGLYSFLENFIPDQGVFDRKGMYSNQWVYDAAGWHEMDKIKFTVDNTGRKQNRLDYSGGVDANVFYLRHCGFTDNQTPVDSEFQRNKLGITPNVDFGSLE
ncbi:MAG: DUF3472 domain-containing protein [Maribacter sp.]|nr:DUF3472 domain-containing protein [Maribacter sp.]